MKAVVAGFNQEKALVGAFSMITNLRMDLFEALVGVEESMRAMTWPVELGRCNTGLCFNCLLQPIKSTNSD